MKDFYVRLPGFPGKNKNPSIITNFVNTGKELALNTKEKVSNAAKKTDRLAFQLTKRIRGRNFDFDRDVNMNRLVSGRPLSWVSSKQHDQKLILK